MIEAVLLSIFAQAIWEVGLSPLLRGSATSAPTEAVGELHKSRYESSVREAVQKLTALEGDGLDPDLLSKFLSQRAVKNLIMSLFVFRLDEQGLGTEQARAEFVALWEQASLGDSSQAEKAFTALLSGAEQALGIAIRDGLLSAHEARSAARHQMMLQHLDAMERRTRYLVQGAPLSMDEVDQLELELRREVHSRHGTITPPDFYAAPRVPIDQLYVMPNLIRRAGSEGEEEQQLTVSQWLDQLEYGVVLGDPGGGKSTLASKLCHGLSGDSGWTVAGQSYTPVVVTLREYSAIRKDRGLSIVDYIEDVASTRYQLNVPAGAVEYLLLSGRLLIIFDGLDELLETHHRKQIRDDVESFQRRFPTTRLLVTSRAVGYEQAPLDSSIFQVLHLSEFTDEKVEEYAYKWFRLEEALSKPEQEAKAASFIEESRAVPDLRTNPLLLALMCNFYIGQNYLPRHLPEVYETCAKMLFETWDRSRGIEAVLPIAEHIRPAMRYLALWIYEDEALQNGAGEHALVEKAVEFLLKFRFDDEHEARTAAEAFISFCAGRAWVFTDTGTTADGEKLFQFTHRTFLEYFAADHLVAVAETTDELSQRLSPRIAAREWSVVAQVAYQLKSKSTLTASDQLLTDLIERSRSGPVAAQGNYLLFAAECLAFLVPSPAVVRSLSQRSVEFLTEAAAEVPPENAEAAVSELGFALVKTGSETRRTVAVSASEALVGQISSNESPVAAALCLGELGRGPTSPESLVVWQEAIKDTREKTYDRRVELARVDMPLAILLASDNELSIADLVEMHGLEALFSTRPAVLQPRAFYTPLVGQMVQVALRGGMEDRNSDWVTVIEELGRVLLDRKPPWSTRSGFFPVALRWDREQEGLELSPDAKFGLAVASAIHVEERAATEGYEWLESEFGGGVYVAVFLPIFEQRLGINQQGMKRLRELNFGPEQSILLESWMTGGVNFLRPPPLSGTSGSK